MPDDARQHLSEEDRYELAAAANAAERSNRPLALLVFAIVLVGASFLFMLFSMGSRAAASTDVANQRLRLSEVQRYAAQIESLRARADEGGPGAGATPIPNILSSFRQYGLEAGIDPGLPDESREVQPGMQRLEYAFDIKSPDLAPALRFIRLAQDRIPGLETRQIRVRPLANDWHVEVTFSRWERTDS